MAAAVTAANQTKYQLTNRIAEMTFIINWFQKNAVPILLLSFSQIVRTFSQQNEKEKTVANRKCYGFVNQMEN